MGIELHSQILSLNTARRYHRSKSQLVPSGADTFKRNAHRTQRDSRTDLLVRMAGSIPHSYASRVWSENHMATKPRAYQTKSFDTNTSAILR